MADNVDITAGTGTTVRTDDIGGVQFPASKLVVGADGVDDGFVSTANPLPVKEIRGTVPTASNVAGSATSVTLLASSASRVRATIANDSTAILYVLEGSDAASTSNYTYKLFTDDFVIVTDYTGQINGIWASATGTARVTEIT